MKWRSTYIPTGEFEELEADDPKLCLDKLVLRLLHSEGEHIPLTSFKTERIERPLTFGESTLIDAYRRGDYQTMRLIIDSKHSNSSDIASLEDTYAQSPDEVSSSQG